MLIYAKKLIGLDVIESGSSRKIGVVENIIIDPNNGLMLALLIKKGLWFGERKILVFQDITEVYLDSVVTLSEENLVNQEEVFKINEILKKGIFLLGSNVITQNGKNIGVLEDFTFDTNFSVLVNLSIKKRLSQKTRIISSERIINILPGKIIIRDIMEKAKISAKQETLNPVFPV